MPYISWWCSTRNSLVTYFAGRSNTKPRQKYIGISWQFSRWSRQLYPPLVYTTISDTKQFVWLQTEAVMIFSLSCVFMKDWEDMGCSNSKRLKKCHNIQQTAFHTSVTSYSSCCSYKTRLLFGGLLCSHIFTQKRSPPFPPKRIIFFEIQMRYQYSLLNNVDSILADSRKHQG